MVEESSQPTKHANKIMVSIFLTVKAIILDSHGMIKTGRGAQVKDKGGWKKSFRERLWAQIDKLFLIQRVFLHNKYVAKGIYA